MPARRRLVALLLLVASCAAPAGVRAARSGDLTRLRDAIATERARGELGPDRIADIAKALAEHEIQTASGADGVARIDELRGCTLPLSHALERRARTEDDVGGAALLALLDGATSAASS